MRRLQLRSVGTAARCVAAILLIASALASCAEIMEPQYRPDDFYPGGVAFGHADDPQFVDASSPPRVRIRPVRIVVLGIVRLPCFYEEAGSIERAGDTVTVRIGLRRVSGPNYGCSRGSQLNYRASVDLEAGTYVLRIRHEDATPFALDRVVSVPSDPAG